METINENEFRRICEEVRQQQGPAILEQTSDTAKRTQLLLRAVFQRVCNHLKLNFQAQQDELDDGEGFVLFQTLEEHMDPEFFYTGILDRCLLHDL